MLARATADLRGRRFEFKTARQLEDQYVRNFTAALVAKDLYKKQDVVENFPGGRFFA
jgi:hypothetical protein